MKGIATITVPKERYSAIDYLLERFDELEEILGEVTGAILTASAYERTKEDPYIYQDQDENSEYEKWVGEETTIGDKYYPPLIYFLSKQDNGEALVIRIEYGKQVFEFGDNYNVVIDY